VLFEQSADGVLIADGDRVCVEANPAACELYGRPVEELIGHRLGGFDAVPLEQSTWTNLISGEEKSHQAVVSRPDGSRRAVDTRYLGSFVRGRYVFALRDVSERLRDQKAARLAEELVENLPVGTYILSFSEDIETYISPAAERMLGYPEEMWSDIGFLGSILHPDDRDQIMENSRRMVAGELDADAREYRVVAADGRTLWVYGALDFIRSPEGAPLYMRGYYIDITERKELEDQLERSQRMETIGRLAGGIAHDFNNLLTAITGYGHFALERSNGGDPGLRHDLEQIINSADRAALLTQQLLAFGRRQILQPRTLDLNELVTDVGSLLGQLLGEHVELVTRCSDGPLLVCADPGRLEQVLVNLAVNARDAMPNGGTLAIEVTESDVEDGNAIAGWGAEPGRYPTLVIRDSGSGMDEETLAQVFEPFFTTKDVGEGTGLGLSTVYGIVKQSGGWIQLESAEGVGTAATIYLPHADEPALDVPEPAAVAALPGSVRILLVEDEDVVRDLVRAMLERHGYEVLEAPGPLEALELAGDGGSCDLLLTDVVMPKMNGRELARRIRVQAPDLHVVYTSGYAPEAVLDGGRLDPGEYFLQKPFTAADLAAIVSEALDAARVPVS
jgi:two-component system, cell cycle sensor histidine kinase and response regulator CckA